MSEMRVVLYREIPEDEEFRRQWNGLVEGMERPEVFYTWEWARAVWCAWGASACPLLFAGYQGEQLAGIAALAGNERGEVCFLAATTADYCDFVSAPVDREAWIGLVMRELCGMGVRELRLASLPADSASAPVLRVAARASGYATFSRPAYLCAQVELKTLEDRARLNQTASHKLKRMTKSAVELRAATVGHSRTWEEFGADFPEFVVSHVGRFLSAGEVSNLVRPQRRVFLMELARLLSSQGWLAVSTLKIDGRSIAWNCGFRFAGSWFYYQPTFDVEARRLSPGSYLLCRILQDAAADFEIRGVDLGLGDEGYKQQYAKAGRRTLHITGCRSRVRLGGHVFRYRAAKLVKHSPRLERAARNFARGMAGLRSGEILAAGRRFKASMTGIFSGVEISFLEWMGKGAASAEDFSVQAISARLLAKAAMRYETEDDTLRYLLRSAKRLKSGEDEGFALVESDGTLVHFCWVVPFEGAKVPGLGQALREPAAGAVLICDGWTPGSQRGRGHEARCAGMVAELMQASGRCAWTFTAAGDSGSELQRAGFVARFSLVRKRKLFFASTSRLESSDSRRAVMDLYPAA